MRKLSVNQVQALVSLHYRGPQVSSVEDILFLGSAYIRDTIKQWRRSADSCATMVIELQKRLDFLADKDAPAMIKLGKDYESPDFPRIGADSDGMGKGILQPFDAASIKRKRGATTFNFCGWCEHGSSGIGNGYSYLLKPTCAFEASERTERHFNSPCIFKAMPSEQFDIMRAALARARDKWVRQKKAADRKIRTLVSLAKVAYDKPLVPERRDFVKMSFKVGDRVVVYVGQEQHRTSEKEFMLAEVVKDDDRLTVVFDDLVFDGGSVIGGYGGIYLPNCPWFMSFSEFHYLLDHPDFVRVWTGGKITRKLDWVNDDLFAEAIERQRVLQKSGQHITA